jgi:hypothetical protein
MGAAQHAANLETCPKGHIEGCNFGFFGIFVGKITNNQHAAGSRGA